MIVLEERAANGCPITVVIAVNFSGLLTQIAFSQSGTNFCTNPIQHVYETLLISRKAIDNVSRTKVSDIFGLLHQATHEAYISSEMFGFIREALLTLWQNAFYRTLKVRFLATCLAFLHS
uniref:Uncharacterized protein n=1 Tax=Gossypium raimondii TaxID=29730 RepID=A0A0D2TVI1_GOSRA|nr:hypothetical protein B456_009G323700 [Gossypium raimondii]